MDEKLYKLAIGALLHDLGKVVYRAGSIDSRAHPVSGQALLSQYLNDPEINDIILYHHAKDLKNACLADDSLAYIVYCADNIAAGIDRREVEGENQFGFNAQMPLASVFNLLNNNESNLNHRLSGVETLNLPAAIDKVDASGYRQIVQELKNGLKAINWQPEYINSVLELIEAHLSFVPSSTMRGEVADISLYDHQRITAAIAQCIYQYLMDNKRMDFKTELFKTEQKFREEKAFLMFTCDISGIQQFIYTIASKGALKALRSRSFYLEILLEHIVDCILSKCRLSRSNLIYTGGGHAYILLPNTPEIIGACTQILGNVNQWFIRNMGIGLFIAYAMTECSGNDLMNIPYQQKPYREIFQSLSRQLSQHKLQRYQAADIRLLNSSEHENSGRECSSCGAVNQLLDKEDSCVICSSLQNISREIIREDSLLLTAKKPFGNYPSMILPAADGNNDYLLIIGGNEIKRIISEQADNILGIYAKNRMYTGYKYSSRLWMGNYYYSRDGNMPDFDELAAESEGIERIAVLRADVDNLGTAFIGGFIREKEKDDYERNRYLTLSRTATLSRQLSMFFKYHINHILQGSLAEIDGFRLSNQQVSPAKKAVIVYSGGDDMFIVGSWEQVIELSVDLRRAFSKFTAGALSFSGGIGIYPDKYPVSRMAAEVEGLEKAAKAHDKASKDALALFGVELLEKVTDSGVKMQLLSRHVYNWEEFSEKIVGQKLRLLQAYFARVGAIEQGSGNSFLYKLADYIANSEKDRINIARYAYLLGRMAPAGDKVTAEQKAVYENFAANMYSWILHPADRKELLTAINLYVYLSRKKERDNR